MNHKQLVKLSVNALDGFDPNSHGVQEYIGAFHGRQTGLEKEDATFLTEVFSGCVRYNAALKVVIDGFYKSDGKNCLAVDKNLYTVVTYLALYRLDELGMAHFRKFVMGQDLTKMNKFLCFFLDEVQLKTWMFAEWCKMYDHSYVQVNLLSPILRWLPELNELLQKLNDRVTGKQKRRDVKAPTEMRPFSLTKPRPRSVPVPEKIPKLQRHRPVPESTYKVPKEHVHLSKVKEENKKKAEKRLMDASMSQFSCSNAEKSEKTRNKMKQYIEEEDAKLSFTRHKARSAPPTTDGNLPIRLNAATILREGVLIQKKEEVVQKQLADYAMGGRDASEFEQWQQAMKMKDLDEQLADIERRRLEGKISFEEAILTRQNLIKENKQKVKEIKRETQEMMQQYLDEKLKRDQEMRQLVEQIMSDQQNAKEAKKKLKEYKQKIVQEVNRESQELMRRALEEAEEEMRQRAALIAKIRAIESVPVIRFKYVDLTETSGAGLLGEMSVAELRERLSLLKVAQKEEEEKKRTDILEAKLDRDQYLMDTLERVAKRRAEQGKEAAIRLEEKRRATKPEIKDKRVLDLKEKLEAKRAARIEETKQSSASNLKNTRQKQLLKEKKTLEEMRWRELEKTREKAAKLQSESTKDTSRLRLVSA